MCKFLLAKIGIDGHDRGFRLVATTLRDSGMEVILMGPWSKVKAIIHTSLQEDPDVIGISTLGGDYLIIPKLMDKLKEKNLEIPVVVGGIIPPEWEKKLKDKGVSAVFHPGTSSETIVNNIKALVERR